MSKFQMPISLKFVLAPLLLLATLLAASPAVYAASVKVSVNGFAITDLQINARSRLIKLERRGANDSARIKMAEEELILDALKLEEAARLGLIITTAEVDDAVTSIARGMRISTDNLNRALQQGGANPDTLRERLKAQLAWNRVKKTVIAGRVVFSEGELEAQAEAKLTAADNWDYFLKEVKFIIPTGSKTTQQRRTAEANQYRASFTGCAAAVELSLSYTDAAVIDLGRRHATQLPEPIATELAGLNVGNITKPRVVENGVSMLAICEKTAARDVTFVTSEIRQEVGAAQLDSESEKYLEELRAKAEIVYN